MNTNQTLEQQRLVAQAHIVTRTRAELRHAEQEFRAAWKELKAEQWRGGATGAGPQVVPLSSTRC